MSGTLSAPRLLLCVSSLMLCVTACRKPKPDVGVRPEFRGVEVRRVVMTPFYLSSGMGLDVDERTQIKEAYERETLGWLEAQRFDVVSPQSFQQQLTEAGVWQIYADGLSFRHSLDHYFLSSPEVATRGAEVVALQQLKKSGALPQGSLLFGEVVYQTQTSCRVFADEVVDFAVVERTEQAKSTVSEVPCVVGHLQSTLVDPNTEQIMWSNRGLVELHVDALTQAAMVLNIQRVVEFVYSGEEGLRAFKP